MHLLQRLGGGRRVRRCFLRHVRFTAQELRVGPRDLEGEADDPVGGLPIRVQDQQVARLGRRLLLGAQRAVPVDRLVEDPHDLLARHHGAGSRGLRRGCCIRGTRRIGRDGPIEQRSRRRAGAQVFSTVSWWVHMRSAPTTWSSSLRGFGLSRSRLFSALVYNLERFAGPFHTVAWFAFSWGALP